MKKNGFTLVEITVCVVLLVTIFLIVVPKVNTIIKERKQETYNSLISTIKDAAQSYVYLNTNVIDDAIESDGYYNVSIYILQENELLDNKLENPLTNKEILSTSMVKIAKENEEYIYEYVADNMTFSQYITSLYNDLVVRERNGLKKDNTSDQNIRYYGSNPNNYVRFNNELWRIIGVFGNNVKLVRKDKLGNLSWDSSESGVNGGWGINQWGESTYEDGTTYEGADLMQYLNKMYYGGETVTCYNNWKNATTTCPTGSLNDDSKNMIDNHTWNTGAVESATKTDTLAFYQAERSNVNGKNCTSGAECNDTVNRTTTWTGYVALPYASDWAYASSEADCETNLSIRNSSGNICKNNNWMQRDDFTWYLSSASKFANYVWYGSGPDGIVNYNLFTVNAFYSCYNYSVYPSIYLKSDILIESGLGTSLNPYVLLVK